ncbi:hypothetical protein Scep_006741 [Stephania cephalantha]|uniref:Uncharacterized protein n=1 Tax=Stephania cephalantha TaxID=152367 RepID=A0AAP0PMI5_9MAGN
MNAESRVPGSLAGRLDEFCRSYMFRYLMSRFGSACNVENQEEHYNCNSSLMSHV